MQPQNGAVSDLILYRLLCNLKVSMIFMELREDSQTISKSRDDLYYLESKM